MVNRRTKKLPGVAGSVPPGPRGMKRPVGTTANAWTRAGSPCRITPATSPMALRHSAITTLVTKRKF
jgi:hypothetical protein